MALIVLLLLPFGVVGKTIICDQNGIESGDCTNSIIDCGEVDECIVHCNSRPDLNLTAEDHLTRACYRATINCTEANHCAVHCTGYEGCKYATIWCSNDCVVNASTGNIQFADGSLSSALESSTVYLQEHSKSSILCTGYRSCYSTHVQVPRNSTLDMICEGSEAIASGFYSTCRGLTVNAHSENTSINVSCIASISGIDYVGVCLMLNINGSEGTNSSITTSCIAHDENDACTYSKISGGQNSSITTSCSHNQPSRYPWIDLPCYYAHISGQHGSNINVSCTNYAECSWMTIDGRNAASLTMGDCSGNVHCKSMTIYCPQQVNGEIMCNLGKGDNMKFLLLYAVNSWDDVVMLTPMKCPENETPSNRPFIAMLCGTNYSAECIFARRVEWSSQNQCTDYSSGCCAEQQPNAFLSCPVPEGMCQKPEHDKLSTVEIVIIFICGVIGVALFFGLLWFFVLRKKAAKKTRSNEQAVPISDESDAFMHSGNQ